MAFTPNYPPFVRYPATLNGQRNGLLSPSTTVPFSSRGGLMERTAHRSFVAMIAEAKKVLGVELTYITSPDTYRIIEVQSSTFFARYESCTFAQYTQASIFGRGKKWVYSPNAKPGDGSTWMPPPAGKIYWRKRQIINSDTGKVSYPATAAIPGLSNHGWAQAVDLALWIGGQVVVLTQRVINWLLANSQRFGIAAETKGEFWHWRYFFGDPIPPATRAYEDSIHPPPPTPGDPDMAILFKLDDGDTAQFVTSGGMVRWVDRDAVNLLAFDKQIQGTVPDIKSRAILKQSILIGTLPLYPANYTGPRTVRTDFESAVA